MRRKYILPLVTLFIFFSLHQQLSAQEPKDKTGHSYWCDGKFGVTPAPGLAYGAQVSYCHDSLLFSLAGAYIREIDLFSLPVETVWDVGALVGVNAVSQYFSISASGGLSVVGGVRQGDFLYTTGSFMGTSYYEEDKFLTVGIPLEADVYWTPLSFMGIGFSCFADLNFKKSFVCLLFCLRIGSLK